MHCIYQVFLFFEFLNFPLKKIIFLALLILLDVTQCLVFYYFMYGSTMGTLRVNQISADNRTTILWERTGDQGRVWNQAYVDLEERNPLMNVKNYLFMN